MRLERPRCLSNRRCPPLIGRGVQLELSDAYPEDFPEITFHLCRTSAGIAADDRIETGQAVSCAVARTVRSLAEVNAEKSARRCSDLLQTSLLRIAFPRIGEEHTSSWMAVRSVDCFQEQFGSRRSTFSPIFFRGRPL